METEVKVTDTEKTGSEEIVEETGAVPEEAVEQTEEQKAAAAKEAEEAAKAAEARRTKRREESNYQRINRLLREKDEIAQAEREAKHAAELKAAKLEGQLEAMSAKAGRPDPNAEPVPPNYDSIESFEEKEAARDNYLKELRAYDRRQMEAAFDKKLAEKERLAPTFEISPELIEAREQEEKRNTLLEKVAEEFGDEAREVLEAPLEYTDFRCTALMRNAIYKKDNAVQILGEAAANPKLFAKIAKMDGDDQIREIDKLAATIGTKKQTQAPPPVTPVSGKGGGVTSIKDAKTSEERFAIWDREERDKANRKE